MRVGVSDNGLYIVIGVLFAFATIGAIWASQPKYTAYNELYREYEAKDPKVGDVVRLKLDGLLKNAKEVLVVLLGDCQSCSIASARMRAIDTRRWPAIAVVVSSEKVDPKVVHDDFPCVQIVNDTELHAALNAYWTPRFAVVGADRKLMALQSRDESPNSFLKRIQ